jgi:hypothetical protein
MLCDKLRSALLDDPKNQLLVLGVLGKVRRTNSEGILDALGQVVAV